MDLHTEAHEVAVDVDGLLRLLLTLVRVAERQVSVHVFLVGGDRLLEHVLRYAVLGLDIVHDGRVVEEHAVGRLDVQRRVVVGQGVLELAGALHVDAEVVVDLCLVLRRLQGTLVERVSLLVAALLLEEYGQVAAGPEVVRLCLQRLLVVVLGPLEVANLLVDVAEVEECGRIFLLSHGDLQIVDGALRVFPLLKQHDADVEVGLEVLWVGLERPLVVRQALVEVGGLASLQPQVLDACGDRVQRVDVLGVMLKNRQVDFFL